MERIPRITGCEPLHQLTFYQFESLERCAFKGLCKALILDGTLPKPIPSRSTFVGLFHHKALELAGTLGSLELFDSRIEEEIRSLSSQVRQWPHLHRFGSVSGWDEINRSVNTARQLLTTSRSERPSGRASEVETELCSRDGLMKGRPDYFLIRNFEATLREYKSGSIRDADGRPITEFMDQVAFYAALLVDNYNVRTVIATVESITGDVISVNIEAQSVTRIVDRIRRLVATVNERLAYCADPATLASASVEACSYCQLQPLCENFKASEAIQLALSEQSICEGAVLAVSRSEHEPLQTVEIADRYRKKTVTLLVPREISGIAVADTLVVQNLRRHGGQLSWTSTSRVLRRG